MNNSQIKAAILASLPQAAMQGLRRVVVLSGQSAWCLQQAKYLMAEQAETLWLMDQSLSHQKTVNFNNASTLLGQEFSRIVFDARFSFNLDALAAVSGTLVAGGLLLIMIPTWQTWPEQKDLDSLRWSESSQPIITPHFIAHCQKQIVADQTLLIWHQSQGLHGDLRLKRAAWQPIMGKPNRQQQLLLDELIAAQSGYYVLIAARGRGKSALAGMFAKTHGATCYLTGPNKKAVAMVEKWAQQQTEFIAPDALINVCRRGEIKQNRWLIVDEAASIPLSLLKQLPHYFSRILFTTTLLGYEGTGRGFLLKFCATLENYQLLTLKTPLRWADNDPLENFIDRLLFLNESLSISTGEYQQTIAISREQLINSPTRLIQFYGLLCAAHYRTTALDLRRLFDAPNLHCYAAINQQQQIIGALCKVNEGGLSESLAHEVWAGRRRPRGNLVAQALSAHAGLYHAPQLRSYRITRVAVMPSYQRQHIATKMINQLLLDAISQSIDFVSVSFSAQDELQQFWQACGFTVIHQGQRQEASSGAQALMAIYPITLAGKKLLNDANTLLMNQAEQNSKKRQKTLTAIQWQTLAGFAFAHRPLSNTLSSLTCLLKLQTDNNTSSLTAYITQQYSLESIITAYQFAGHNALIKQWRNEVAALLSAVDNIKAKQWQEWVLNATNKPEE